jgi:hypothetical protein
MKKIRYLNAVKQKFYQITMLNDALVSQGICHATGVVAQLPVSTELI